MNKIVNIIMAVGNAEIEEIISEMPNVNKAESVESIDLIEEILNYENYDYIVVNTLLSPRKTAKLADFTENSLESTVKPKIIALVENLNDKKLTAQLVGLGVNAFVTFDELSLVSRYMDNYPNSFDLSVIADTAEKADTSATRVINGTISIGIFNLDNGAGATTCSLKLAEEIANCGYRVICLEIDQENFKYVKNKNKKLELISATKEEKEAILQAAFGDPAYQFIVIDFGKLISVDNTGRIVSVKNDYVGEFLRCNYKIGMCFASPWHTAKLNMFLKTDFFVADIAKNQLFLLVCGIGSKEAIEDHHELLMWERHDMQEFIKYLKNHIGINSIGKTSHKFGLFKRRW